MAKNVMDTLRERGFVKQTVFEEEFYEKLGNELGLRVSPVGRAFAEMRKVSPDTELYNEDKSHPAYAGSCLAALRHYKTLFGEVPGNTEMLELPAEVRKAMCSVISQM